MQDTVTTSFESKIAGELPRFKVLEVVIGASQTITVGSVLGSTGISASGETFKKCDSSAEDGSQNPVCVALEAVTTEASGAGSTAKIHACFMGEIDVTLNAGGTDTQYTHVDALRARGIYLCNKI